MLSKGKGEEIRGWYSFNPRTARKKGLVAYGQTLVSTLLPRRRVRRLPAKDWRSFLNLQRTEKAKNPLAFASGLTGAADEARTRYLHLGKVALYQMSYSRICDFEKKRWSG